jgi:lysophospholipase L1-like esterase
MSGRRIWCFRIIALCLPFAALALVELALGWAGVGRDLRLVEPAGNGVRADAFRFNPRVDQAYYGPTGLDGPEPRPFLIPKPTGTFRIVVVGASTVVGFPYPSELAFPRLLEHALRAQGLPRDFEVLNAGITAINSFGEADLVEQAVASQPDLIVVYTGHNEFVGPGGVGSKSGGVPASFYPALLACRRTRTYQLLAHGLGLQKPDDRQLLEQLPGDLNIPLGGEKFRRAEDSFRSNLQRIVGTAVRARVPLLLTTPVVNLRHQSPLQSLPREGLTSGERETFEQALHLGEELLTAGRPADALEALDQAWKIDHGFALVAFRRGQALEGLDRLDEARAAYQSSCDLDACRFRAPGSFANIIAQVAADARSNLVDFHDTASLFAGTAPRGIPGDESLLEHVHFSYSGNWRLALILAEHIARKVLGEAWRVEYVPDEAARDRLCGVIPQDQLVAESLVLMMLARPPLNQGADALAQFARMRTDVRRIHDGLPPREQEVFGDLSLEKMQLDLIGELFGRYEPLGMDDEAGQLLRRGVVRQPWRADWLCLLAEWEFRHGDEDEALRHLDQAETWNPGSPLAARWRASLNRPRAPSQK